MPLSHTKFVQFVQNQNIVKTPLVFPTKARNAEILSAGFNDHISGYWIYWLFMNFWSSPQELQNFAKYCGKGSSYQREDWVLGTILISTEEANFYGEGQFLRRRLISMEKGNFYRVGLFLRRRPIQSKRRRMISTEQGNFYATGLHSYEKWEQFHRLT